MIRSIISKTITSPIKRLMNHLKSFNGLRALSRNFVTLDPVLNSQYELAQPITFTGDFEIEVEFNKGDQTTTFNVLTGFSTNHHWIATHINNKVSVSVGGTMFSGVIPVFDGKHHLVKLTRVGELVSLYVDGVLDGNTTKLGDIVFDQIGRNGSGHLFDGIISNVKFTDKSGASDVVTTFKLDNSPAANDYTYSTEILNNNTFTDNANARHYLIAKKGWIISDGGAAP